MGYGKGTDYKGCVPQPAAPARPGVAVFSLLTGALVWGLIWYPYRGLRDAGVDGLLATSLTYSIALAIGAWLFRKTLRAWWPQRRWLAVLFALACASGGCNLGYVLATLHGEVVRVLLLFYLAPLWTVLLARALLGERLNGVGAAIVSLSLAGAVTILWQPGMDWPVPRHLADWLGLGAGLCFALFNVLSRVTACVPLEVRSMVAFAGSAVTGFALLLAGFGAVAVPVTPFVWSVIALIGVVLAVINPVVQYGLTHVAANRAIVIMLTEVGVAAVSAWGLAGESFGWREVAGGALIVAASLFSARMESENT